MSGHSKWSTIKRKKGALDAKRGAIFTKVANIITIAAREGGGNPETNAKLAVALEKARAVNMPNNNVERAVKRGTGEIEGVVIEPLQIEAYGPEGSAFIIEAISDNKNRTLAEIRNILDTTGGKMAGSGSVAYQFDRQGVIRLGKTSDEIELAAIDAGAQDTKTIDGQLEVYTKPQELKKIKDLLADWQVESADIELSPQNPLTLKPDIKAKVGKLAEALAEHDDVNEVYSNVA